MHQIVIRVTAVISGAKIACIPAFHALVRPMNSSNGVVITFLVIAIMLLISTSMELRRKDRAIDHLLKVMDSVQTDLEKGRVRQALDTLHVEFANMEDR